MPLLLIHRVGRFLDPGWSRFVGAFLYYALLTALVLGGADFGLPAMAAAYGLPPLLYLGLIAQRATQRLQRAVPTLIAPGSKPSAA